MPKSYVLKNPLKRGYSANSVSANIAEMKRAGVPEKNAIAAAFEEARKAWRKKHGRKKLPPHLQVKQPGRHVAKNVRHKTGRKSTPRKTSTTRGVVDQDTTPGYIIETSGKHGGVVKIKKSQRGTVKANPRSPGRKVQRAIKLYQDFKGEDPKFLDEWAIELPDAAMQVGKVTGILYKARVDGKEQEFLHEFTGRSRPTLAASADGDQLLLLGGNYRFTERGIVDGTANFKR